MSERSERIDVTVPATTDPHPRDQGAPMSERSERIDVTVPATGEADWRLMVAR
jgi:hypothetical protein